MTAATAHAQTLPQDDLRVLMHAVTATTEQLQQTHVALQEQVRDLQRDLAEANERLRRARSLAALGEMAAGIAHELRNPLGSIQLYVQMLSEDVAEQPRQRELCEKVSRAVGGLDAIVEDVLAFARDTVVRPEASSAADLFDRAIMACAGLLEESPVVVTRDGADVPLEADPALMTQAVGNIVRNAVEAMEESDVPEPRLRLSADRRRVRCPDGRRAMRIVLTAEDNGPGIPADAVNRIFNPFFTTRASGTGLGLAIVHRIVDAHGGHISAGAAEQGGACVELFLPPRISKDKSSRTVPDVMSASDGSLADSVRRRIHQEGAS